MCSANQWTGFCMISASVMKGLNVGHNTINHDFVSFERERFGHYWLWYYETSCTWGPTLWLVNNNCALSRGRSLWASLWYAPSWDDTQVNWNGQRYQVPYLQMSFKRYFVGIVTLNEKFVGKRFNHQSQNFCYACFGWYKLSLKTGKWWG